MVKAKQLFLYHLGALDNLSTIALDVDCLILIDNSVINQAPIIHTALSNGAKCFLNDKITTPQWIQNILDTTDEMSEDDTKVKVCNQIQSVLDEKFIDLVEMDIDDLLMELEE
jgi:hypothetical protein